MTTAAANTFDPAFPIRVRHGGETRFASREDWTKIADELVVRHGAGVPDVIDLSLQTPLVIATPKAVSGFGHGELVTDEAAKTRIEKAHATLVAGGVAVDTKQQFFATGTRMAQVGYDTQSGRKTDHEAKTLATVAAWNLSDRIVAEKRADQLVGSRELAASLKVNGKISVLGYALTEQAIRGICQRIESPSLRYLLGLRDRIAGEHTNMVTLEAELETPERNEAIAACKARMSIDRNKLADVLHHELVRLPETGLKLRTRANPHDVFAVVSPSYVAADAPSVVEQIVESLPQDARGSWAYDPTTTTWELRANIWTPTPVHEQAVGEPFEGFASFSSRDNGTGRFRGGGGIMMIRCLNASTYVAGETSTSRIHRGRILEDVAEMVEGATQAIGVLCDMWGMARAEELSAPKGMTLNEAFPGFWRWMLTDRRSELAAILPGRTEAHVAALGAAYIQERRDPQRLVRADLAQAWTRHIQDQLSDVRREAEVAAGAFLASRRVIGCTLRDEA